MKTIDKIFGAVGLVLFLFSLLYYSIQNIWDWLNWITLILGVLGLGYFIFIYYKKREKVISKQSLQYGSNVMMQILIMLGIVGLVAFISTRQHIRSDMTANKLYSLADQTEKILEGLEKDVKITAFFRSGEQRGAQDILDEYGFRTSNIKIEFIDPDETPQVARQYQVEKYNTVVVEAGAKREMIEELSEVNLTNAIMKVTREQDKVIYFLTGHGERSISEESADGYKQAAESIKKENYIVRELNLVRSIGEGKGIPDSCTVLVIVSPKSNFFPTELDSVKSFLDQGGKVLLLVDPEHDADVEEFANNYHVTIGNDMVIDASGVGQLFGAGPGMPLVSNYDKSIAITKDFGVMTFYPYTCSVLPQEDKGGYDIKEILKTGGNSWAEVDFRTSQVGFNEGRDIAGPVSIAVIVEKKVNDKKLGLVIFGDSDFSKNGYWKNQGNSDLFLNTINYLAEEEDLISIRPKEIDDRRVTLTQADVKMLFYLVVIAIPLLVIIAGVVIYLKRNR